MRPDGPRDPVAGPDSGPEPPFPIKLSGPVIKGFGRGSKELGIPTANIPPSGLTAYPDLPTGVYYGYCALQLNNHSTINDNSNSSTASSTNPSADNLTTTEDFTINDDYTTPTGASSSNSLSKSTTTNIYPSVLSIGYNPFYKNTVRSIEIHVLSSFEHDFYGAPLNLLILGFIRPEYDYVSKESLIEDIQEDCRVAERSLERGEYTIEKEVGWKTWLEDFKWVESATGAEKGVLEGDDGEGEEGTKLRDGKI